MNKKRMTVIVIIAIIVIGICIAIFLLNRGNADYSDFIDSTDNDTIVDTSDQSSDELYDILVDNEETIINNGLTVDILLEQEWTKSNGLDLSSCTFYYDGHMFGVSIEDGVVDIYKSE